MINPFKRYQVGLTLDQLFPQIEEKSCACGCANKLSGRKKRWASKSCQNNAVTLFFVVKGDTSIIRKELFNKDGGRCQCCNSVTKDWEADHILPVFLGGGGCDLDNFQTLCKSCHTKKTNYYKSFHRKRNSSQAAATFDIRVLNAVGADSKLSPKASIEIHKSFDTFSLEVAT